MEHSAILIPPAALATVPTPLIAAAIDQLIETLDARDPDPDIEDGEAGESAITERGRFLHERQLGDDGGGQHCLNTRTEDGEQAWPEWHTRGRHKDGNPSRQVQGTWGYHEDDEDADRDSCLASDDDPARRVGDRLPGDRDDTEDGHDREETRDQDEAEQMCNDVPCLPVVALEPNPFTGQRPFLGVDNLQPTFRDNGAGTLCAETGRTQYRNGRSGAVRFDRRWLAADALVPPDEEADDANPIYGHPPVPVALDDPSTFPDLYASGCVGTCLEPVFKDGVCLVFSKTEEPKAGDFVGMFFKPGAVPTSGPNRWVKRLAMNMMPGLTFPYVAAPGREIEPLVIVEMLNPPRRFAFRASQILAIHKVVGEAEPGGNGMARYRPAG